MTVDLRESRTFWAYLVTRMIDTPFWGLYNLLPFILYRDLGATPFEIALLVTLKPLSSFFSGMWGGFVYNRPDRLVSNIIWARVLSVLPYFLFPWMQSIFFFIFAHGFYMMLSVGTVPAWMEILKQNLPEKMRSRLFSGCQAFGYLGGGLFPLVTGLILDDFHEAWRWLFPLFGTLSLGALFFQRRILIQEKELPKKELHFGPLFKDSWQLFKEGDSFVTFQMAFMAIGGALMLLQPALPIYFVDVLQLSYTELALAITLAKGVGYIMASPFLANRFSESRLFSLVSKVALFTALFPLVLLTAQFDFYLLFLAYFLYGVAQAGSEFLWNMSGPLFSKERDSSLYSFINITMVGLRGAMIPPLGSLLLVYLSPNYVMAISMAICLLGGCWLGEFSLGTILIHRLRRFLKFQHGRGQV